MANKVIHSVSNIEISAINLIGELSDTIACNPKCPYLVNLTIKYCTNQYLLQVFKGHYDTKIEE